MTERSKLSTQYWSLKTKLPLATIRLMNSWTLSASKLASWRETLRRGLDQFLCPYMSNAGKARQDIQRNLKIHVYGDYGIPTCVLDAGEERRFFAEVVGKMKHCHALVTGLQQVELLRCGITAAIFEEGQLQRQLTELGMAADCVVKGPMASSWL